MKICAVSQSFYPYIGGVTRYLQALGKKMIGRGDELVVVHLKAPDMPDFEVVDGVKVYRMSGDEGMQESMDGYFKFKELIIDVTHGSVKGVPTLEDRFSHGYSEYLGFNLNMYEKVKQVYEAEKFDVLHVHDFQVMPLAFLLRGEVNVPTIFTWHIPFTDATPLEWREFLVRYMRYYDRVIFSTDEFMRTAVESGLDPEKVSKINPFIDTGEYLLKSENTFRQKYGIPAKDHLVLCVSRIDPRKGQEYLILAMQEVIKKHPNTTCVFIGNGSLTKKIMGRTNRLEMLENMVYTLGLQDHVSFLGKVDQEDLMMAYDACDMLVQPSVNEGFGLVISEAMCFGKPVIGSNVGGIPEQIASGVNGYLFKPTDHEELAACINTLIERPALRKRMGAAGKKIANSRFCVDRGFKEHCCIYDNIYLQQRIKEKAGAKSSLQTG
jgi:glycosyltransferase involved in cell wall biosynthesis